MHTYKQLIHFRPEHYRFFEEGEGEEGQEEEKKEYGNKLYNANRSKHQNFPLSL